jgi:hypothetical protein
MVTKLRNEGFISIRKGRHPKNKYEIIKTETSYQRRDYFMSDECIPRNAAEESIQITKRRKVSVVQQPVHIFKGGMK